MTIDLSDALAPKSDQLDAADLIGSPPQIFTITAVREGAPRAKGEPKTVDITLAEFPRVWRPSKGMLRVLADNYTKDVSKWVGKRVELYGDPDVYFGKERTGGTRISRLSHIDGPRTTRINPRGGKDATWTVRPLPDAPATPTEDPRIAALKADWKTADPERRAEIEQEVAAIKEGLA
jgi:hypothetical protein